MMRRILAAAFGLLLIGGCAEAGVGKEGENYRVVSQEAESKQPKVTEFFSYGCPHCYRMEAFMDDYSAKRPKSIRIERVPLPIHDEKGLLARAYYVGEALGLLEKSHIALYQRLHDHAKPIGNEQDLIDFFVALGADKTRVESLMKSPEIEAKNKAGVERAVKFGITSTPSFVVNDKYYTDGSMARENLGAVLDELALRNKPAIFQ